MANLSAVLKQLQGERDRAERELERLENALAALNHLGGRGNGRRSTAGTRKPRSRFSAATRARMATAQRARWAKLKQQKARPKRTLSAAARNRIAAAQRARWAKVKAAKKQKSASRVAKKPVQKVQAAA